MGDDRHATANLEQIRLLMQALEPAAPAGPGPEGAAEGATGPAAEPPAGGGPLTPTPDAE
ncbi:hypothetical protein [Deinococcus depolymerans]|uniref:Uncharacterized protein n=1 Tax=Deinococcus depolymerans TaxID=392408 RepID=A0ABP3M7F5_9DEIO